MDPDEGINLEKALLLLRGYRLYDDIWSDQPPILTHLLTIVLRLFGLRVNAGRLLVLLLVCALIWAYFRFIQTVWGSFHAIAGAFLLVLLPEFPNLSVAVMVGLPAIAFAVISLYFLARWHQGRQGWYLILSALFLALSVLTKIFTAFLAPIFLAGILIDIYAKRRQSSGWKKALLPAVLWAGSFGLILLVLGLVLVGPHNLSQLLEVHISARSVEAYTGDPSLTLAWHLQFARFIFILAIPGLIYTSLSRRWLFLYPAAWMVGAYLLLSRHYPVWYHHQLLVTIPAACLGAAACGEVIQDSVNLLRRRRLDLRSLFSVLCLALVAYLLWVRAPIAWVPFNSRPSLVSPGLKETSEQAHFLNQMSKYAPETNWVVTDTPIYAFWAKLPVVPPLAVFTDKRLYTGDLSDEEVLRIIQNYFPEQMLFTQYSSPLLDRYLEANYRLVYSQGDARLFVRDDVAESQPP
jgi:MFS family permease